MADNKYYVGDKKMSLFSDCKFAFPFEEENKFYRTRVFEIESGLELEEWVYRNGSTDEETAKRSLNGFDKTICRIESTSITREDYKFQYSISSSPLVFKYGRRVA